MDRIREARKAYLEDQARKARESFQEVVLPHEEPPRTPSVEPVQALYEPEDPSPADCGAVGDESEDDQEEGGWETWDEPLPSDPGMYPVRRR